MEKGSRPCDTLYHYFRIFINKYTHLSAPILSLRFFNKFNDFCAPSAIVAAGSIAKPESFKISLPRSTFVPSKRTTNGKVNLLL